jgi:hypothetical protein
LDYLTPLQFVGAAGARRIRYGAEAYWRIARYHPDIEALALAIRHAEFDQFME